MNRFSFARTWAVFVKEFQQILRDRLTFGMAVGIPILQLVLFGYAINSDPKQLPTAVVTAEQGPLVRSLLLVWDERYALLTVVITALGRAVSEVGAVMIVGGNIDGYTRVMTTAIALETSKGDLPLAMALGLVLLAVVLLLNLLVAIVRRWRERLDGSVAEPQPAWRGVQA